MNEAPKKIWVRELPRKEDGVLIGLSYHTEPEGLENGTEHPYIRADIVDELVEAVNDVLNRLDIAFPDMPNYPPIIKARAALKKLEESHD